MRSEQARIREIVEEFWLRMLIPSVMLVLLLVLLVVGVPSESLVQAGLVVAGGMLSGGAVGISTGIRGPHWVIYVLIFTEVAALLMAPDPWRGFALLPVPVCALGYGIGKEIAHFREAVRAEVDA